MHAARLALAAFVTIVLSLAATGAPPQTVSYQGYLTNSSGTPLNGSQSVAFRLYAGPSGGAALWAETQAVSAANGVFSALLGSITALNLPFDVPYFLGITVGSDPEMTPRIPLAASPYAIRAIASDSAATAAALSGTVAGSQITGTIDGATISGSTLAQLQGQFVPASVVAPPRPNTTTIVDPAGNLQGIAMAVGPDGLPVIAYGVGNLKVAKCGNAACSSGNTISVVDATGTAGEYGSIAIGADGLPVISYFHQTDGDLKVAKCANAACSGTSTITTIDSVGVVGLYTSIAIGADAFPVVSYFDATNGQLKVAKCANAACTGAITPSIVDATGGAGTHTSLAIGFDGLPVISYFAEPPNLDLKVVKCGNPSCSAQNTISVVDSPGDVGAYSSLTIGIDGLPLVAYRDFTSMGVKVAKCGNSSCSAADPNVITMAAVLNDATEPYGSITIGADGLPVFVAWERGAFQVRLVRCGNSACSSGNSTVNVTATGSAWGYTTLALGSDGLPVIAYRNGSQGLVVTKCANAHCVPYFRRR